MQAWYCAQSLTAQDRLLSGIIDTGLLNGIIYHVISEVTGVEVKAGECGCVFLLDRLHSRVTDDLEAAAENMPM